MKLLTESLIEIEKVAKKHVFGSEGTVAGTGCQTLACALEVMGLQKFALQLTARQ